MKKEYEVPEVEEFLFEPCILAEGTTEEPIGDDD